MTTAFSRTAHPSPVSDERRAEILAAPGFGRYFTDHMVLIDYDDGAWHDARVVPYGPFTIDPATMVLHYAQEIFEGLKAYQQPDGSVASFRPQANAARLNSSADRLGMPRLPEDLFLQSLRELVDADRAWVPTGGESSLYFRPFMFATEVGLGVRPANRYVYAVIASPGGRLLRRWDHSGQRVVVDGVRARSPRWHGSRERPVATTPPRSPLRPRPPTKAATRWSGWTPSSAGGSEEMGGMNLFFVFGSGADAEVVTPELSGSLLPGVTRDSLLQLARDRGYRTAERRVSTDEWAKGVDSGELTEVFACGTAAVITPVGSVKHAEGAFDINGGRPGAVTMELREALTSLQRGEIPDPHGWMTPLV